MITRSITNDQRRGLLKGLLRGEQCIRVMETHNPISAMIAENACVIDGNGQPVEFDAFWSSSLTDSSSRGLPDIEVLSPRARLAGIDDAFSVTSKPLMMDADTGGPREHFELWVRDIERHGVSALIIEDKSGLKQNSLLGASSRQRLADVGEFCEKIGAGKAAQATDDFQIFARLESLILGHGIDDALMRADAYLDAGSDGIMIHSRRHDGAEVLEFTSRFRDRHPEVPLIAVPTAYPGLRVDELAEAGVNVVIYANHMLRASLKAMQEVCETILRHGRALEAEEFCAGLEDILHFDPPLPVDRAGRLTT
ncbi:phosphoenolpyruvate mutase [Kitasatospora sp. NBC_01266]|uniref:phosphoenolpyruvate mutase n=1 Tax=Kitasatospora sp. NBC_01266 TaxID=2903572 RepID=UPI002E310E2D|nr:phosphoenolpyruvate mutase [Kitasatospora sp. NBC_01266]